MTSSVHRRVLEPEELLFREGEGGDTAFVIESGKVEITALHSGQEVRLATLSDGEIVGEMALIDGQVRSATARAVERTTLVLIRRDQVLSKINDADPLLRLFLRVILSRLRTTNVLVGGAQPEPTPSPDDSLPAVRERALAILRQEQALETALTEGHLQLYFQPVVDTGSRRALGFEALTRWIHPDKGVVPPGQFISTAERTGLIVAIGRWVISEACTALARFREHSRQPLTMAVNLSARQLSDDGLIEHISYWLERCNLAATDLTVEVTESMLMVDPDAAVTFLHRLRALGVMVAVDDFGTGYSSLSYLHRFPIDILKIDRSFVGTMMVDEGSLKIVRTVALLARELELAMVAEGVEAPEQLAAVAELGCDKAQGYLFARPVPEAEAAGLAGRRLGPPS